MKLLPKSEIDKKKAQEQHLAIQEGLKIAKRVDNLREVAAEEEKNLNDFRTKTIAQIHEETTIEAEKLASLKTEVKVLEDRREAALKPIEEERFNLDLDKAAFNIQKEDLDTRVNAVAERERATEITSKEATSLLARAENKDSLADEALTRAADAEERAKASLESSAAAVESARKSIRKQKEELMHRDLMASSRERSVSIREEAVAKQEKFIREEKIRLADREKTLARNLDRVNNPNG